MKKNTGFTLIELMIVVAIIAIIAAIAIPNLLRSRIQSNESAAIGNLRTILGAEVAYHAANYQYAIGLDALQVDTPPFLDGNWAVAKSGYNYAGAGTAQSFEATASPAEQGVSGQRGFFVDASGVIRFNISGTAAATDTPIGEIAA